MSSIRLYNTLSRKIEEFVPLKDKRVGLYTCGPTVYDYPQIGNWRTFVFEDILRRVLEYNGYQVTQVMNATDVGHLTGDNLGDADLGEDRMEKAARRERKTAWEIAEYYIADFIETRGWLNILAPTHFVRATDHINEQVGLINRLVDKGLAYVTATGVFFDAAKFPGYGKLGGQKLIDKRVAAREELVEDETKRHPFDFALWKFSPSTHSAGSGQAGSGQAPRQMEWDSPWGRGFPGWHIECSAMSMKYLGESFDIHTGGVDHIAIHHANEIAQSEGATGKPFARYWLHGEFLMVDGGRMGKSLGNAYTLHDIKKRGLEPMALRYLFLTGHYRQQMNFTWEALAGAQKALTRLKIKVAGLRTGKGRQGNNAGHEGRLASLASQGEPLRGYGHGFLEAVNNDLNMPQALAAVWGAVEDEKLPDKEKYQLLLDFDRVLGLGLGRGGQTKDKRSEIIDWTKDERLKELVEEREKLRGEKKYKEADRIREEIEVRGYEMEDTNKGPVVEIKSQISNLKA